MMRWRSFSSGEDRGTRSYQDGPSLLRDECKKAFRSLNSHRFCYFVTTPPPRRARPSNGRLASRIAFFSPLSEMCCLSLARRGCGDTRVSGHCKLHNKSTWRGLWQLSHPHVPVLGFFAAHSTNSALRTCQ